MDSSCLERLLCTRRVRSLSLSDARGVCEVCLCFYVCVFVSLCMSTFTYMEQSTPGFSSQLYLHMCTRTHRQTLSPAHSSRSFPRTTSRKCGLCDACTRWRTNSLSSPRHVYKHVHGHSQSFVRSTSAQTTHAHAFTLTHSHSLTHMCTGMRSPAHRAPQGRPLANAVAAVPVRDGETTPQLPCACLLSDT